MEIKLVALGFLFVILGTSAEIFCYQETANVTQGCCGFTNGTYALNTSETVVDANGYYALWDGNYSTYGNRTQTFYMYINYSIPTNAQGAIWQINQTVNYSMTLKGDPHWWCFKNGSVTFDKLVLRLEFHLNNNVYNSCFSVANNTWLGISYTTDSLGYFRDEGVYWNLTTSNIPSITHRIGGANQTLTKVSNIFYDNLTIGDSCTTNIIGAYLTFNNTVFTGTSVSSGNYSTNVTALPSGNFINRTYNWTISLNISNLFINSTSYTGWVVNYRPNLTICGDGNQSSLNFSVKDADSGGFVYNGTANITLSYSNNQFYIDTVNYYRNMTNTYVIPICLYPAWANLTTNITTNLKNFPYYFDATYSNSYTADGIEEIVGTAWLYYYLFENSTAQETLLYVVDSANNPLPEAIVDVYRNGIYLGREYTDSEGKAVTYLEPYGDLYSFNVIYQNTTVTIPAFVIVCGAGQTCPPYTVYLRFVNIDVGDFFKYLYGTSTSCAINASYFLICNVTDSYFSSRTFELSVNRKYPLNYTNICTSYCSNSPCSISCNLGNTTNAYYEYQVSIYTGTRYSIYRNIIDYTSNIIDWGLTGILLGIFLILVLFFAGAYNPVAGLTLSYFGIIFCQVIGMFNVGWDAIIGLGFVVGIFIWRLGI